MSQQVTNCYNCKSEESTLYDIENGYKYVKCKGCGLIYLNQLPDENEIAAAHELGVHGGETEIDVTGNYKKSKIRKYVKVLGDFYEARELQTEGLRWLDVGCGFGELLEALNSKSNSTIYTFGTEFNKKKIKSCKSRNLNVDYLDLDQHQEKYDFISLLNVFSHLPNPPVFIEKLKKNLKPGGELLIETGHTSHLQAKYHPKPYYAPDHLSFANKEVLENILKNLGFEIIQTRIYRGENFPKFYDLKGLAIQLGRIVLNRGGSWKNFFTKYPDIDMYVRAKLPD